MVIKDAEAKSEAEMKPYAELVEHSDAKIEMLPIKGGKFTMGSPASEKGRKPDEGDGERAARPARGDGSVWARGWKRVVTYPIL